MYTNARLDLKQVYGRASRGKGMQLGSFEICLEPCTIQSEKKNLKKYYSETKI